MHPDLVVARYGMQPVQIIPLGSTSLTLAQFESFLRDINPRFTTATYDLLQNNCNNFSNEVVTFLVGTGIPQFILDLPNEALSTPLGYVFGVFCSQLVLLFLIYILPCRAMLRPMIENVQREMSATGAQPFSIPFNDPSLAVTVPGSGLLSRRFKVAGQATLHLKQFIRRIKSLNESRIEEPLLSDQELVILEDFSHQVTHEVTKTPEASSERLLQWKIVYKLLLQGAPSPVFFPALGILRVLLLSPVVSPEIVNVKRRCIIELEPALESENVMLRDSQKIMMLAVLMNACANPAVNEVMLAQSSQFLPFVFEAISESPNPDVRLLSAHLISNCCLALKMEEEMVITTIICGVVEILDRVSREQEGLVGTLTHQQTTESVVAGVGLLLLNFEAARNLSLELGLAEVLHRLHVIPMMRDIKPLLAEVVAMI